VGNLPCALTYQVDGTRDHLRVQTYGDRALIVLVSVTPHQGRREGRLQGEAAQGETFLRERARDVFILNGWNVSTGEPHDTETVLCGSGRGRWSRASNGTSPTAYFINSVYKTHSTSP
jgi:hypothetical protein